MSEPREETREIGLFDQPLSNQLRQQASAPIAIGWESRCRQLMNWAADTIDAANAAIGESNDRN